MHPFFYLFGRQIPGYGLMMVCGLIVANLFMTADLKRNGHTFDDLVLLEAVTILGALVGSKLLYIIVSFSEIDFSRLLEPAYFNALMMGGFVFYGGLIGGVIAFILAGKLFHLNWVEYMQDYIYAVPLMHGIGRIGCFLAGCCYGIPYDGPGAVVFPEDSFAPSGVSLFPVQLLESFCLLVIFLILYILTRKKRTDITVGLYFLLYGTARFFIEYLRGDDARKGWLIFSTSQWISIFMVVSGILLLIGHNYFISKKAVS